MDGSTLIRRISMLCPVCDKKHVVEERKRYATIVMKEDTVTYEERFFYCANANEEESEFTPGSVMNDNLSFIRMRFCLLYA